MKLGRRHAGELLANAPVAEHLFRRFSQLRSSGQDRRLLDRLELLGLFDGSLDFRLSATGTDDQTRLRRRLDSTPAARHFPVALTQASSRANNPAFGSFDHPVAMLDRPLPCLIRALPAVTRRDQLICRNRHLLSHHSTAIPSAHHIRQRPSLPNGLHLLHLLPHHPSTASTNPIHRPNFLPTSILDSTPSALEDRTPPLSTQS